MPDLKSELTKVIASWEPPEVPAPPHRFQPSTNTSRATFDFVRDNPGIRRATALNRLIDLGHKKASVSSLLVQFIRQGQMRETNGVLFVTQPEYTPLKASTTMKNAKKPKRNYTRKVGAELPVTMEEPKAAAVPEFNAEDFVNGLTLKQAKAVYSELKKVFE